MYLSSLNSYHNDQRNPTHKVHDARGFIPPPLNIDESPVKGGPMILLNDSNITIDSGASLHQGGGASGGPPVGKAAIKIGGISLSFRRTPPLVVKGPMRADDLLTLISLHCAREAGRNILLSRVFESISDPTFGSKIDLPASVKIDDAIKSQVKLMVEKGTEANLVVEGQLTNTKPQVLSFDHDPLALVTDEELLGAAAHASSEGFDSVLDHIVESNEVGHYQILWC